MSLAACDGSIPPGVMKKKAPAYPLKSIRLHLQMHSLAGPRQQSYKRCMTKGFHQNSGTRHHLNYLCSGHTLARAVALPHDKLQPHRMCPAAP